MSRVFNSKFLLRVNLMQKMTVIVVISIVAWVWLIQADFTAEGHADILHQVTIANFILMFGFCIGESVILGQMKKMP